MMSPVRHLSLEPKIIFFTDFDGTITKTDSNDFLVSKLGYGEDLLNASNLDVLEGRVPLRDAFVEQMHSVDKSMKECIDFQSKHTDLDPGFAHFYQWAKDSNIPVIVLSGGIESMIRALLSKLLGSVEAAEIEILSNKTIARSADEDNSGRDWEVQLHDDSPFGMDKSVCINTYAETISKLPESQRPALFFAGDGVSDLSAARSTDFLFAKRGQDLVTYCEREGIPFTTFDNWETILSITKHIYKEKNTVEAARSYRSQSSSHKL